MTKILLSFCFFAVLFTSCREKQNVIPPAVVVPVDTSEVEDSSYVIQGVADITVSNLGSTTINLALSRLHNNIQDRVTLSIEGLPKNVTAGFFPEAGFPDFSTILTLKTSLAKAGVYPITLKGVSDKGKVKKYNIKLNVTEDYLCDKYLSKNTGLFNTFPANDSNNAVHNLTSISGGPDGYYWYNLYLEDSNGKAMTTITGTHNPNIYTDPYFTIDCDNQTMTMAEQTLVVNSQNYVVSGNGTFDYYTRKINFNYTVTNQYNQVFKYNMIATFKW